MPLPPSTPLNGSLVASGRRLLQGVGERLQLTQGGLVGSAYARRGACVDEDNADLDMHVGLDAEADTAGLFCTDATTAGDYYGVRSKGYVGRLGAATRIALPCSPGLGERPGEAIPTSVGELSSP